MQIQSRWTRAGVLLLIGILAIGTAAFAQTATHDSGAYRCSNRTLFGNYGYSSQGQALPAPGLAFLFTSTGRASFDGAGTVSWVEHTVIAGELQGSDWTPSTSGTYTVNSDCTGTMVVTTPNAPVPLNIFFSVVQQGKQFYSVANGNAISGVWTKMN